MADLVIGSDGVGIPRSAVEEVRRTPGVATALGRLESRSAPASARRLRVPAAIVDPDGWGGCSISGSGRLARALRPGEVAVSRMRADMSGLHLGDSVGLVLGDGAHTNARVAAVYERDLGFGEVLLPSTLARGHLTSPLWTPS